MFRYLFAACLLLVPLYAPALDDPMRPPSAVANARKASAASGYTLTSTYIARDRRLAVINGTRVKVGDLVGAAKVTEILPTQVHLTMGQKRLVVKLLPVSVKTPAQSGKRTNDE